MSIINQFNGLGGTTVTRESLIHLRLKAIDEENEEIIFRIDNLLAKFPHALEFVLDVIDEPATETVPNSFLYGLDYEQAKDELHGLGKSVSPTEVYDMITAKIIKMIEAANARDYKSKWNAKEYGTGYTIPFNFASKKRYRGVNVLMLTELEPLENPFFLTFKQIKDLKGKVKKGAKGFEVVYFTKIWKAEDRPKNLKFSSYDKTKVETFAIENKIENDLGVIPMLKYYHVYNGKDIEGIDFGLETFKIGFIDVEKPADEANRMPIGEAILKNYPKPQPTLKFGGNRAFYSPSKDGIQMPYLSDFETVQDYYRTLFHEYSHSTGASKRLKRDFSGSQGSKPYAFEELVAELGAIFLSAEAGIVWHNNKNHAAYLKGWNSVLTQIKDDNKFIMKASTAAQKVADFVLQFDENGDPLYFEDLKKIKAITENAKVEIAKKATLRKKFAAAGAKDRTVKTVKKGEELQYIQNNIKIASINKLGVITWHKKGITTALRNKIRKDAETIGKTETTVKEPKKTKEPIKKAVIKKEVTKKQIVKPVSKDQKKTKESTNKEITNASKIIFEHFEKLALESKNADDFRSKVYVFMNGDGDIVDDLRTIYGGKMRSFAEACFSFYDKFHNPIISPVKKVVSKKPVAKKSNPKPKNTLEVIAISDVLKLERYKDLKPFQAKVLFEKFKNDVSAVVEMNGFEAKSFKDTSYFYSHSYDGSYGETILLEDLGKEFIASVLGRLDSLQNQKSNYALFEGLKVPITQNIETVFTDVPEEETLPGETTPGVDDNETIPTKNKLMQMHFESLPMDNGWENFMQNPAKNMKIAIWGPPKNGKTAGALQKANYLTKFGNVLYNFADQGFNLSTQELWRNSGLADNAKAEPSDSNTLADLEKEIATGKYTFVFIDMISDYIRKEKISPDEFKTRFIQKYPNVSFILIFEVTKGGNFKGDQGWTHVVDAIVTVENFLMENRGRYGMGYHIVWDEGFKRFAPKRYDEIKEFLEPEEELVFTEEVERI